MGNGNAHEPGRTRLPADLAQALVDVLEVLQEVNTSEQLVNWAVNDLQRVLPHEMMACGVAVIDDKAVDVQKLLQHHWPESYFQQLSVGEQKFVSPVMARWAREQRPQFYVPDQHSHTPLHRWEEVFNDFGMRNMVGHGVRDLGSEFSSYFAFARLSGPTGPQLQRIMQLLTPHMHQALQRSVAPELLPRSAGNLRDRDDSAAVKAVQAVFDRLTERERIVLHWLREGKTNREIALICGRSEHTVKNQVESVFQKLAVSNRTQACARVVGLRLLD